MKQQWLDRVKCELRHSKLPHRQADRLVGELRDHLSDMELGMPDGRRIDDDAVNEQLV